MDIVSALDAHEGICCAIGAGGTKTTLYTLAQRVERAVVTATVRIPPFESAVADFRITEDPASAIERASRWPLGVVRARDGTDRYAGYELATVDSLADLPVTVLVKADGARMRQFKAPNEHEPRIPSRTTTVIPIASAHVVGEPLDEAIVHRVDRVASIVGMNPGDTIRPEHVAMVMASDRGGMKDVPGNATVIPLINMVDDDSLRERGREIADAIHERVDVPRVVLAAMRDPNPLVEVIQ